MASSRNYYDVLGVSKDADEKEIKSAFRKMARQWHPDINKAPEAEAKFKEVNEAYEVLSDKEKRELVPLTINGKKVEKWLPPHIAAIVRDIEAHPDEIIYRRN